MKKYTNPTEEDIIRELKPFNDEVFIKYIKEDSGNIVCIEVIYTQYCMSRLEGTWEINEVLEKLNYHSYGFSKYVGNYNGIDSERKDTVLLKTIFHQR